VNSNHPEFDSHRYTVHDLAKHVIIHELEKEGWLDVHVNPDDYGPDLIATSSRSGNTWTIEVEVKNNWNTGIFQYRSLHISHRKARWHNDHHMHITCNADWSAYLIVPPSALREARVVRKSTTYSQNELFLEIPITECQQITRSND
jgi:hypothetical protein